MPSRLVLLSILLAAGCPSKHGSAPSTPPPAGDAAALCADLDAAVTAAAGNFADRRGTEPVQRDGLDGVAATRDLAGAERCAILKPDPAYPDDMIECELAAAGSMTAANELVATWTTRVASCPVVAGWASKPLDHGHSWAFETDDDHLLEIQLDIAGDEPEARPVIRVRRPEI